MSDFSELPDNVKKNIFFSKIKKNLQEISDNIENLSSFNSAVVSMINDLTDEELMITRDYYKYLQIFSKIINEDDFKKITYDIDYYNKSKCQHRWKVEVHNTQVDRPMLYTICRYCNTIKR